MATTGAGSRGQKYEPLRNDSQIGHPLFRETIVTRRYDAHAIMLRKMAQVEVIHSHFSREVGQIRGEYQHSPQLVFRFIHSALKKLPSFHHQRFLSASISASRIKILSRNCRSCSTEQILKSQRLRRALLKRRLYFFDFLACIRQQPLQLRCTPGIGDQAIMRSLDCMFGMIQLRVEAIQFVQAQMHLPLQLRDPLALRIDDLGPFSPVPLDKFELGLDVGELRLRQVASISRLFQMHEQTIEFIQPTVYLSLELRGIRAPWAWMTAKRSARSCSIAAI